MTTKTKINEFDHAAPMTSRNKSSTLETRQDGAAIDDQLIDHSRTSRDLDQSNDAEATYATDTETAYSDANAAIADPSIVVVEMLRAFAFIEQPGCLHTGFKDDGTPILAFPIIKSMVWKLWASATDDATYWGDILEEHDATIKEAIALRKAKQPIPREMLKNLAYIKLNKPRVRANVQLCRALIRPLSDLHAEICGKEPVKHSRPKSGVAKDVAVDELTEMLEGASPKQTTKKDAVLIKRSDRAATDADLDAVDAQRPKD